MSRNDEVDNVTETRDRERETGEGGRYALPYVPGRILITAPFCLCEQIFLPAAKRSLNYFSSHFSRMCDIENVNLPNQVVLMSQDMF